MASDVLAWRPEDFCVSQPDAGGCSFYTWLQGSSTTAYDPNSGDPDPGGDDGSLKIVVPFTGNDQAADFRHDFPVALDLAGKTLFVRIKLDSGLSANAATPGIFQLGIQTGQAYVWGASDWVNLPAPPIGCWQEIRADLSALPAAQVNAGFDPSQVVGIHLRFASGGAAAPDLATATFHVDTIGFF
jgi:hypothetical protein